ncbi:histone acetyltransferase [Pseudoalteromonas sp. MSK9-3]|uniref:GNAT family N-acetyltransferase n=1 Tax=Pseudoalteromonas sp. MSK9-3 TaxID=1897633 RepID=UPI000E6CCCA3|nr:GNAT family N-acetyltransferase [Pseudoalteromonas sp. MSK9-3]RJE77426.1 histone acetyltransferase [Pseudoalteromonas sp. MSK9-3]
MDITIRKAEINDRSVLNMLWQFYLYHQSAFSLEDLDSDGRYDVDEEYLSSALTNEEDCTVYLVYISNQLAGFATVEPTEIAGKEMPELADIFILPKYRKQGAAKFVVQQLMQIETNHWHVAVYLNDIVALKFWNTLFPKLNIEHVYKVEPAETEGFHEFVVINT